MPKMRMKPMREIAAVKLDEQQPPVEVEKPEVESEEDDEQDDAAEAAPAAAAPAGKKEKPPAVPRESKVIQEMRTNEDRNLKDWLEEIAPGGAIRVKVTRTSPKVWKGLNVGGALATYSQQIDEDWIRDHHGGGDFYLIVQKPKASGAGWQYAGGRVLNIAGDPRTDDVYRDKSNEQQPAGATSPAAGKFVEQAFSSLERQLEREQQRERNVGGGGPDTETMRMLMGPMQRQVDQMATMLREKDAQLVAAQQVKPQERDEFRDKMLDKLLDGDSARITALRTQYESELRQVKEGAMQNESRLRDSFERDKLAISMSHDRELNALRSAYDMRVAAQETSHTTGRTLMDGEIRRLQADLTEAKSELAALRLKKEKTILEQASEFAAIKDAIGEISGGDDKEPSTFEKVLGAVSSLPMVQNQLSKLGGGEQAQPQPQQQQAQPQQRQRLLTGPDGNLYRQNPDGSVQLVRRRAPKPAAAPGEAPLPDIPATTVKVAVDFLETAFRGGQDPEQVATSVRSMIPADVLAVIRDRGVDGFLTDIAKIEGTSPLASQAGRNWTRKVGKSLVGE